MRTIKTILTGVFLFVISIGFAQPPGGGGQQGPPSVPNAKQIQKMVSQLAEDISMTDEQENLVLGLYTAHFKTVKQKISGNARPNREEMETLENQFEKEVKALLTEEQQKKFDVYQKKNGPGTQRKGPKR